MKRSLRLVAIAANTIEHYETALFALLAPFIAPLFFKDRDPVTALILTYASLALGICTRPAGALFFGWLQTCLGDKRALLCALFGMSLATFCLGCIPTCREIGSLAPLLLAFGKMMQNFCASGASSGGAVFALEHTEKEKRCWISSLWDSSSMCGAIFASCVVALLARYGTITEMWRTLFWIGSCGGFLSLLLLMLSAKETHCVLPKKEKRLFQTLRKNKKEVLCIVFASGFSYAVYATAFTLMNGFVPLVTDLSKAEVLQMNTLLLVSDMCLLPCMGYLATKVGKEWVMSIAAFLLAVFAIPLFSILEGATPFLVGIVRFCIVFLGVAFAATYHAWAVEQVLKQDRFIVCTFSTALGSQIIGAPTAAISLMLYQKTQLSGACGIYLALFSFIACCVVIYSSFFLPSYLEGQSFTTVSGKAHGFSRGMRASLCLAPEP